MIGIGGFLETFKKSLPTFSLRQKENFKHFVVVVVIVVIHSIMTVGGGQGRDKKNGMNDFFPVLPYVTICYLNHS